MNNDLHRRLSDLAEQQERLEKLTRQATRLQQEVQEAQANADRLARQLAKEERDVEKIEGASLAGLLASLMGQRAERIDKERQEAQVAQFRYEEARFRAEGLAKELEQVRREMAPLRGADDEYRRLVAEKEAQIRSQHGPGAEELLRLDEAERAATLRFKEIQEAQQAGLQADSALGHVASALASAQGWGTWDLLGGGLIATAAKHSKMDEAQRSLSAAQQSLARFRRELADVDSYVDLPEVEISGLLRFADYFFDGLIVDWAVQNRINQSLRAVEEARGQVGSLLSWLDRQAKTVKAEAEQARAERARFVKEHQGG